jgi:hypothetical protein
MYTTQQGEVEVKIVKEGRFMPRFRVVKMVGGRQVLVTDPLHDTKEEAEARALRLALE